MLALVKRHWVLVVILIIAAVVRIVQARLPGIVSWDGSVYVGMGKYLYSGGAIGTWEIFRPVMWPLILGAFWKIGLDSYVVGQVLAVGLSLSLIVLAYAVGERMKRGVGMIAAVFAATLPLLFRYSAAPMVDIPSAVCALGALYVYMEGKRYSLYFAGLLAGLAFLWRFPHGLVLVVLGVCIVISHLPTVRTDTKGTLWKLLRDLLSLGGGFILVVAPYLIINAVVYGNPLLPYIQGNAIIKHFPEFYHKGFMFYFRELFTQSVMLIFAIVPLIVFCIRPRQYNAQIRTVIIALVIYGGYFLLQPHKETRYMIAFLPYVVLLASLGISTIASRFRIPILSIAGLLCVIGLTINISQLRRQEGDSSNTKTFSSFFATVPGAHILSTSPFPVRYGDIKIVRPLYDNWQDAYESYVSYRQSIDYIALDSCVLEAACADTDDRCRAGKTELLNRLSARETPVFAEIAGKCALDIYHINH